MVASIAKEEGLIKMWRKGLSARLLSVVPVSTTLISCYELIKQLSRID